MARLISSGTYTLNDKEIQGLITWYENHQCNYSTVVSIRYSNCGVGIAVLISCSSCNSEETNITDYDCW